MLFLLIYADQRKLGFTMRIKKSTLSEVQSKFEQVSRKNKASRKRKSFEMADYEKRLSEREQEEIAAKKAKHEARMAKKKREREEKEKALYGAPDAQLMAMMNFSSFGESKKS